MTRANRLLVIAGMIVLSAAYAVIVKRDPSIAAAIASGYVALVLTIFVLLHVWRKP